MAMIVNPKNYKGKCSDCGEKVDKDDLHKDTNNKLICGDCGIISHCFCEYCDDYTPLDECEQICCGFSDLKNMEHEDGFALACHKCYIALTSE